MDDVLVLGGLTGSDVSVERCLLWKCDDELEIASAPAF
jgi:hypothetical protein